MSWLAGLEITRRIVAGFQAFIGSWKNAMIRRGFDPWEHQAR